MSAKQRDKSRVLQAPKGTDPRWQEKVEIAVEARKATVKRRQGKPASFRSGAGRVAG